MKQNTFLKKKRKVLIDRMNLKPIEEEESCEDLEC
jgi:hypothetical protein